MYITCWNKHFRFCSFIKFQKYLSIKLLQILNKYVVLRDINVNVAYKCAGGEIYPSHIRAMIQFIWFDLKKILLRIVILYCLVVINTCVYVYLCMHSCDVKLSFHKYFYIKYLSLLFSIKIWCKRSYCWLMFLCLINFAKFYSIHDVLWGSLCFVFLKL